MAANAASPDERKRRLAYVALASAAVLWGASFTLGKLALAEVTPPYLILYRFALASVALLPFVRWRRLHWSKETVGLIVLCAVVAGPFMFVLQFEGLARTTASSAALLVATAPPMLALAAVFFDGERPTRLTWFAIGLAVVGAALLVGRGGPAAPSSATGSCSSRSWRRSYGRSSPGGCRGGSGRSRRRRSSSPWAFSSSDRLRG